MKTVWDKCSWKYCREESDQGIIIGTDEKEYPICYSHWVELCKQEGTVSENILKYASVRRAKDEP
jgi:hypothetical protein|tara:strand:- start:588 stop:782 length:195 start_codon:yes stop_codon:yes gene_type:complete